MTDTIDLLQLPGTEALGGIEAPNALEEALPSQHFVTAGDATAKVVGDVKERSIAVGYPRVESE